MTISSVNGANFDVSREKAVKFVNADDKTINRMARMGYNKVYGERNKKFDKRVNTTLNALPAVAVASGLAIGKGMKGSLLSGLSWGLALAAATIVGAINNKAAEASPKLAKAERKHPVATLLTNVAASVGAFFGMTALASKVINNKKVGELAGKAAEKVSPTINKTIETIGNKGREIIKKTKVDETIKNITEKVSKKVPESVTKGVKELKSHNIYKQTIAAIKKGGKYIVKNAPSILVFGTLGAVVAKGISDANKKNEIKNGIKETQFQTAKTLVNGLDAENKALKAEKEDAEAEA